MVPVLISTAKARRTISYGSVSSGIDYTSPRIDEPWEVALKRVYNYKKWDDVEAALLSIEG